MQDILAYSLAFGAALVVSFAMTPIARVLASRFDMLDRPAPRKIHAVPKPLLGGIAVYFGIIIALLLVFSREYHSELIALLVGSTFMVLAGLLDDKFGIRSRIKLLVVIPIAALILVAGGLRVIDWPFSHIIPIPDFLNYFFGVALTVLWTTVVTTAFAILDHMDGLCAGVAAIVSSFFLLLALMQGQYLLAILASSLIGASLGFLFWNRSPASIFMGDSGALLIGFLISALAILLRFWNLTPVTSWMIPIVVLAVPLFDISLVVYSRIRRGVSPASAGKDHLAHRLSKLWSSNVKAVRFVYLVTFLTGLMALLLTQLGMRAAILLFVGLVEVAIVAAAKLEQVLNHKGKESSDEQSAGQGV